MSDIHQCPECGRTHPDTPRLGPPCYTCSRPMLVYRGGDTICPECNAAARIRDLRRKKDLRRLIGQWRVAAIDTDGAMPVSRVLEECASEVEALLDEDEDG